MTDCIITIYKFAIIILFLYAGYEPLYWFHNHILKLIALNVPDPWQPE